MNTEAQEYPTLRAKMAAQKAERAQRYASFEALMAEAWEAGVAAGNAARPSVMIVEERANPLDDLSPLRQQWIEPEGPCGFAWVNIYPANSSFGRWALKTGAARKAYGGGLEIWISLFNQSVERKEACASAMAAVLRRGGLQAYANSRLD